MWERFVERIEKAGGEVQCDAPVQRFNRDGKRIASVTVQRDGQAVDLPCDQVITSAPVTMLLRNLNPAPPPEVMDAVNGLRYRDFLIVVLLIDQPKLFDDNWIYVHSPEVNVGRIQNFKNWSPQMVPDQAKTSLGMEYFCNDTDGLWHKPDNELIALATDEIQTLGLADGAKVYDGCVIRQPKAYPVYDADYQRHLGVIRDYLRTFENLQTIGRNGMHRYNNQDHSMLCGLYAARNVMGASYDLWDVNTERSYYEEQVVNKDDSTPNDMEAVETATSATE